MHVPSIAQTLSTWTVRPGGRRLAWALFALLCLWLIAWAGLPPVLKWQLEKQASATLGRTVTVDRVDFTPWTLELEIRGLRVADAAGRGTQFGLQRLYVDAELQSLLRLAPVVDALVLEQPRLQLRHLGAGRYDVDDVIERLQPAPDAPPSAPMRFALFNLSLTGGAVEFVDEPAAITHRVDQLVLDVPFLSNLGSRREVQTRPRLAFALNGSAFDTRADTTPFAQSHATDLRLQVPSLDLAPYLRYWPARWPLQPRAGSLAVDLRLQFEQREAPQVLLSGEVALSDVQIQSSVAGGPVADWLRFSRLGVSIQALKPLERRLHLSRVVWDGPAWALGRDAQGRLDVQRIASAWRPAGPDTEAVSPKSRPADPAWQVALDDLAVHGGSLLWHDAAVKPAAALVLDELQASAQGLSWPVQQPVPFALSTRLGSTSLSLQGAATAAGVQAQALLDRLSLAPLAPYLSPVLAEPLTGVLSAELSMGWQAATADRPMGLTFSAPRLSLSDLALGPARRPLAAVQQLTLQDAQVSLSDRTARIGRLQIQRPRAELERDPQGTWSVQRWLRDNGDAGAGAGPRDDPSPPWALRVLDVSLADGALGLTDALPGDPVRLNLSAIQVRLQDLRPMDARQPAMPLTVSARVAGDGDRQADPGRIQYTGTLRLPAPVQGTEGLLTRGRLLAEHLPVHLLVPYFGDRLNLELLRADTSYRGTVEAALPAAGLRLALDGDVAVDDFRANTLSPGEELLNWRSLNLRGLELALSPDAPLRLAVGETVLSDYFARVIINEQGRINLQGLIRSQEVATVAAGTPSASISPPGTSTAPSVVATADGARPDIRFGPVSLVNGQVAFSDRFIQPNYSANLSELSGGLSAFSNGSTPAGGTPQLADLALRGRAEGTAALDIIGQLNPLAQPLVLDIRGTVRDLELPPLSPYSAKYAGYGIDRGKLNVEVQYRIAPDGQLNASNQIVLNQLAFGERVGGADAPNLPVKLAVALLADRNGVIDINLPINGSINDPQFRLGPIMVKLIFNLIGKAITAPFSLLASAFGGGGDELRQVEFAPGSSLLSGEGRRRLDMVAKALADRPALVLTVVGQSDLEIERSGWRRARLDAQVLAEKRRSLARSGAPITGTLTVTPEEYPGMLKSVYQRADISKPRNLIGMARDIPVADMEALLLAAIPVTPDAMRDLAVARGVAVKDYLASRALPEDRMFLGAPDLARRGEQWVPQVELKLAPR